MLSWSLFVVISCVFVNTLGFQEGFEGGGGSGLETVLVNVSGTQNKMKENTKTGNTSHLD